MRTIHEVMVWCLGAAARFGDPAAAVGLVFCRYVPDPDVGQYRGEDCVFGEETHKIQTVEIPEDRSIQYYQKYAHMLAERWGMKIHTRAVRGRNECAYMIIVEKA